MKAPTWETALSGALLVTSTLYLAVPAFRAGTMFVLHGVLMIAVIAVSMFRTYKQGVLGMTPRQIAETAHQRPRENVWSMLAILLGAVTQVAHTVIQS